MTHYAPETPEPRQIEHPVNHERTGYMVVRTRTLIAVLTVVGAACLLLGVAVGWAVA